MRTRPEGRPSSLPKSPAFAPASPPSHRARDLDRPRPLRPNNHFDIPPPPLLESQDAQQCAREVANDNRQPDVAGMQAARRLQHAAHSNRDDELRDDRDEEGAG